MTDARLSSTSRLYVVDDIEAVAEAMWRWTYEQHMGLAPDDAWPNEIPSVGYWRELAEVALEALKR